MISHYKDPYEPTRIQWKVIRCFFRGSDVSSSLDQSCQKSKWFLWFLWSLICGKKKKSFLKVETSFIKGGQPACKGTGWASGWLLQSSKIWKLHRFGKSQKCSNATIFLWNSFMFFKRFGVFLRKQFREVGLENETPKDWYSSEN